MSQRFRLVTNLTIRPVDRIGEVSRELLNGRVENGAVRIIDETIQRLAVVHDTGGKGARGAAGSGGPRLSSGDKPVAQRN